MFDDGALQHEAERGGHEKRGGHGGHEIEVERAGQEALEERLHHVGGVSANHQKLAVRHVDHADQSVRDRQSEGGEQQHAAERQPGEHRAEELAATLCRRQLRQCNVGGAAHGGVRLRVSAVGLFRDDGQQQIAHLRVACGGDQIDGFTTLLRIGVVQRRLRPELIEALAQRRIGFLLTRLFDERLEGGRRVLQHRVDGLGTRVVIGREQRAGGGGRGHLRAQHVVERERAGVVRLDRRTRDRVDVFVVLLNGETVPDGHDRVVGERLEERGGLRRAVCREMVDGLRLGVEVVAGEGGEIGVADARLGGTSRGGCRQRSAQREQDKGGSGPASYRYHAKPLHAPQRDDAVKRLRRKKWKEDQTLSGLPSLPAMNGLHGCARTVDFVFHTTLN